MGVPLHGAWVNGRGVCPLGAVRGGVRVCIPHPLCFGGLKDVHPPSRTTALEHPGLITELRKGFLGREMLPLDTQLDAKGALDFAAGNRGCLRAGWAASAPGTGQSLCSPSCIPIPLRGPWQGGPMGLPPSLPEQAGQVLQPAAVLQEEGGPAGAQCQAGGLPPAPALVPHRRHAQGGDGGEGPAADVGTGRLQGCFIQGVLEQSQAKGGALSMMEPGLKPCAWALARAGASEWRKEMVSLHGRCCRSMVG